MSLTQSAVRMVEALKKHEEDYGKLRPGEGDTFIRGYLDGRESLRTTLEAKEAECQKLREALLCHEDRAKAQDLMHKNRDTEAFEIMERWRPQLESVAGIDRYKAPEQVIQAFMRLPRLLRRIALGALLTSEEKKP